MKRLRNAFLWIVCYGGACWFGIKTKLGFDILVSDHWKALFDKSVHAHWPTEMASKKLVCKVLLAFIIIGILGLSVVTKQKKRRIPIVKGDLPEKGTMRPAVMLSQGKISSGISSPEPSPTTGTPAPAPAVNSMAEAVRKISDVVKPFDANIFPHVKLENTFTQLVVSDDSTALMLKILPIEGTWKADLTALPEESQWTFEDQPPKNVLKDIIESTATLARLEPEAQAIAVVLVAAGNIENAGAVKNYLEENRIRIAALDNQAMPEIQTWESLLAEFYPQKEKEDQDETSNSPENI